MQPVDSPLRYLAAIPLPEGPTRVRLAQLQAIHAAGLPVERGLIARCWADATGGNVAQAREYLSGRRPWPAVGRKRGKLIRAVEAWESSHVEAKP